MKYFNSMKIYIQNSFISNKSQACVKISQKDELWISYQQQIEPRRVLCVLCSYQQHKDRGRGGANTAQIRAKIEEREPCGVNLSKINISISGISCQIILKTSWNFTPSRKEKIKSGLKLTPKFLFINSKTNFLNKLGKCFDIF